MATDPRADVVGDAALSQGLQDVFVAWDMFIAVTTPVALSYAAAVAWGWYPGDVWLQILGVAHGSALCATLPACRLWGISQQTKIHARLMISVSGVSSVFSYTLLCPWTKQEDLAMGIATMPMLLCVLVLMGVSLEIGGLRGLHAGSENVFFTVTALAALIRSACDIGARSTLQPLLVVLPVSFAVTRMTRSLGAALLDSQRRLAEECTAKEAAMRGVASSRGALSRVLQALCNAVFEVDAELNLSSPSWQVHDMLLGGGPRDPQDLHGRSLLDFMATHEDATKLRTFIHGEAEQVGEHRAERRQQGPASVVNVEMHDSQGVRFSAELYGACLVGDGGNPSHLLGARLARDLSAERAPPAPSDEHFRLPWEEYEATPAQVQQMLPRLQGPPSIAPGSQDGGPELRDTSCIEVRFDAGSVRSSFTRGNLLTGSLKKSRRLGMLDLLSQADAHVWDWWVFREVNAHHDAEIAGQTFQPTPFAGPLNVKLPKVWKQQVLQADRAWLQIHDGPTRTEEIPATVWMQGLRLLDRSEALAVLEEEDVDAASESSDDIEHESVSNAGSG